MATQEAKDTILNSGNTEKKKKKKSGNTSKAKPLHVFANSLCLYIISTVAELSLGAAVYFALLWV